MTDLPEQIVDEFGMAAEPPKSSPLPAIVMAGTVGAFLLTFAAPPLARFAYDAIFHPEKIAPQTP